MYPKPYRTHVLYCNDKDNIYPMSNQLTTNSLRATPELAVFIGQLASGREQKGKKWTLTYKRLVIVTDTQKASYSI